MATKLGFITLKLFTATARCATYRIESREKEIVELPLWMFAGVTQLPKRIELQILDLEDPVAHAGNAVFCPQCGKPARFFDGTLGYEAIRCDHCHTETDANNRASTSPWPPSTEDRT